MGQGMFEKLVSGMYVGEIACRIMLRLAKEGSLFGGRVPEALYGPPWCAAVALLLQNQLRALYNRLALVHVARAGIPALCLFTLHMPYGGLLFPTANLVSPPRSECTLNPTLYR